MKGQTWAVLGLLAASCERSADRLRSPEPPPAQAPPPASTEGAGVSAPAAPAPPAPPPGFRVPQVRDSAGDDLPHRRQELAWLASVGDCVPPRKETREPYDGQPRRIRDDGTMEDTLTLALDAYDGRLVLCAQAMTRRGPSVFFDDVSFACWNVDPATAAVTRRADLGRSYFRCQDGACPPVDDKVTSHDGTQQLVLSADRKQLSIVTRPGGAPVRAFPFAGRDYLRGELTLVGHMIFAAEDMSVLVFDDRGNARDKLDGSHVHVVDEGHVLAIRHEVGATLYELATRKSRPIQLTPPYVAGAVRYGGAFYAVDGDARKLVMLDPKTLQPRRALRLPICP